MAESDFVAFLRIAHRVVGEYLSERDGARPPSPERGPAAVRPVAAGNGTGTAAAPRGGSRFEEVRAALVGEMVERTGYPPEMLERDLDLEGELGIDTVKQVAAIAAVREQYQLDVDPAFRLRDFNTLRKVTTHIAERLERATA